MLIFPEVFMVIVTVLFWTGFAFWRTDGWANILIRLSLLLLAVWATVNTLGVFGFILAVG